MAISNRIGHIVKSSYRPIVISDRIAPFEGVYHLDIYNYIVTISSYNDGDEDLSRFDRALSPFTQTPTRWEVDITRRKDGISAHAKFRHGGIMLDAKFSIPVLRVWEMLV